MKIAYAEGRKKKEKSLEQREKIRATLLGNRVMNNGKEQRTVLKHEIDKFLSEGWVFGQLKTEAHIASKKAAAEKLKAHGYKGTVRRLTNGSINRTTNDPQIIEDLLSQGYWYGLTKRKPSSSSTCKHINDITKN